MSRFHLEFVPVDKLNAHCVFEECVLKNSLSADI